MSLVEDVRAFTQDLPHVVLAIGSFDGVHLGHQRILLEVRQAAERVGGTAAALTLKPHPREFFRPESPPNLLTSFEKKIQLIAAQGVGWIFVLPFIAETAALTPEQFVTAILHDRCRARQVIVGDDFRFGKDARGDCAYLREIAAPLGIGVSQAPAVVVDGERVSSSLVRRCVLSGHIERAAQLLGRPHSVIGEVVSGRGHGARLGFPTANIQPHHSAVPPHGVYIAQVVVDGQAWPAAVNIGMAPTIPHDAPTIEVHILEFEQDIRGRVVEVVFHKHIRSEIRFPSLDALVEQIARDVGVVRSHFREWGVNG